MVKSAAIKPYNALIGLIFASFFVYIHIAIHHEVCSTWPYCPSTDLRSLDFTEPSSWLNYILTGLLSLSLFILALSTLKDQKKKGPAIFLSFCLLMLITCQFVCAHLSLKWQEDPFFVTFHILLGFAIAALVWWSHLNAHQIDSAPLPPELQLLKPWTLVALVLLSTQIVLGAWSSACYAAFSQHHLSVFPLTNNRMWHQFCAYVVTALIAPLSLCLMLIPNQRALKQQGILLLITLLLEFVLGLLDFMSKLPTLLTIAHAFLGGLLLLIILNVIHHLSPKN